MKVDGKVLIEVRSVKRWEDLLAGRNIVTYTSSFSNKKTVHANPVTVPEEDEHNVVDGERCD